MRAPQVAVLLWLLVIACTNATSPTKEASPGVEPAATATTPPTSLALDDRFVAALLAAAREYSTWGRVDEHPQVAPAPCTDTLSVADLEQGFPSHVRRSQADDGLHREKLYYLFAGLHGSSAGRLYASLGLEPEGLTLAPRKSTRVPVGFAIVKESWTATTEPRATGRPEPSLRTPGPVTAVVHADKTLHVGEPAELFIMIKLGDPDTEGTDLGWIYGTVTADGTVVTSAGTVQPCMDCHEAAPHERLFGLQTTKAMVEIPKGWGEEPLSTWGFGLE